MKKESFDWLHEELRRGFEILLDALPKGNEPVLLVPGSVMVSSGREVASLSILNRFASITGALLSTYPPEKVREIMGESKGGSQMTLVGDTGPIVQDYLD